MKDIADDLALIVRNAIAYIKDLEQQINELKRELVQEPVAWLFTHVQSGEWDFCYCEDEHDHDREMWHRQPLYAAPPQRSAEPVQEPVAWAVYDIKHGGSKTLHWPEQHSPNGDPEQYKAVPLYSAPPQRKPLDDLAIADIYTKWDATPGTSMADFARAIERAHGIGV